jgi:RNA polymerase sigma-70 factor (ECF subfamily)
MAELKKNTDKHINNLEDQSIIKAILDGDINEFAKIQKKYKRLVVSVIRRVVRNDDEVPDLVQETFIKTYNALPNYDFSYNFYSWLMKIASNYAIDYLRKRKLNTISIHGDANENDENDYIIQIPDRNLLPDEYLTQKEQLNQIESLLDKLPANFKNIIVLRLQKDMDYSEIAEHLSIPLGTVKATLFRAKKMLGSLLEKYKINKLD